MREYLIDRILPSHELHILGGPSGAGKTRLLFSWLRDWQANKPFLFNPKTNQPYKLISKPNCGYIALDRSQASVEETMELINLPELQAISLRDSYHSLDTIKKVFPDANLVVLDGIGCAVPLGKHNDYGYVSSFLKAIGVWCTVNKVTILGIHHTAKMKENEQYLNPRQRLSGSASWGAYSETVFLFEPKDAKNVNNPNRKLFVLPRNAAEYEIDYTFKEGQPVPIRALNSSSDVFTTIVWDLIIEAGIGKIHISSLLNDVEPFHINKPTLYNILHDLVNQGLLFFPEKGYVQRNLSQN